MIRTLIERTVRIVEQNRLVYIHIPIPIPCILHTATYCPITQALTITGELDPVGKSLKTSLRNTINDESPPRELCEQTRPSVNLI